jgi:hypothetical protein
VSRPPAIFLNRVQAMQWTTGIQKIGIFVRTLAEQGVRTGTSVYAGCDSARARVKSIRRRAVPLRTVGTTHLEGIVLIRRHRLGFPRYLSHNCDSRFR